MKKRQSSLPPVLRSEYASVMKRYTGQGLVLQQCDGCHRLQYPPRELCRNCFSDSLQWRQVDKNARLLASVELMHSFEPWFSERLPWLLVAVGLNDGLTLLCHGHPDLKGASPAAKATVTVQVVEDAAGCGVLVALPGTQLRKFQTLAEALASSHSVAGSGEGATSVAENSNTAGGAETSDQPRHKKGRNHTLEQQEKTRHGG